jgi:hypothetical protein
MAQFKGVVGYHVALSRSIHRIMRRGLVPTRGPRSRMLGESLDAIYTYSENVKLSTTHSVIGLAKRCRMFP